MRAGATHVTDAAARPPGVFTRLLYWALDLDEPGTVEAGIQRLRSAPGYFASLPPEAREAIRRHDGPENHGPPLTPRDRAARRAS